MVQDLSHITFVVRDLDRMERLLLEVLGARKVYDSGQRTFSVAPERFYLVGEAELWIAVMEGESLPARSYNHIAFKINETEYNTKLAVIQGLGLEATEGRPRVAGEGRSIYFHDHDNHLFELHTGTLEARLKRYG